MKVAVIVLCLVAAIKAAPTPVVNAELNEHWEEFKTTYAKKYNPQYEYVRRLIWEANLKFIQSHNLEYNLGRKNYGLGMNKFGDMTFEEFSSQYLGLKRDLSARLNASRSASTYMSPMNSAALPDSVDWRKKGYVTPVKNQGQCGSCWSFSTTGSLEGQYKRKTGNLISFSEKQLMDCSGSYGNMGCNGGLMDNAFNYIEKYGIERESDYPYVPRDGPCRYDASKVVTKITGHTDIPSGDEDKLKEAVANVGPISVAIDAGHPSFQFYNHGVYDEPRCSSTRLDHGVLAIGYGVDPQNNKPYWLVKNSWGAQWGKSGFIWMSRDKDNQCGIATQASYPLL